MRGPGAKERGASLTKQIAVMQLVDRVFEVETPQQWVRRQFGGTQNVTSAVGFDFAERKQLANATVEVAPHPLMNRTEDPIER